MDDAKKQVLWGCAAMCRKGYALGTSGNVSARVAGRDLFVVTPTSVPYDDLGPDDLVLVTLEGAIASGWRKPSIEADLHREIYRRRPDVAAVVHTHSVHATTAGSLVGLDAVPLADVESALYLGGHIRIAPFAPPGTRELAEAAVGCLGQRAGVILESHGAVGVGSAMADAMTAADVLERACMIFLTARAAGGVKPLPEDYLAAAVAESAVKRGVRYRGA